MKAGLSAGPATGGLDLVICWRFATFLALAAGAAWAVILPLALTGNLAFTPPP